MSKKKEHTLSILQVLRIHRAAQSIAAATPVKANVSFRLAIALRNTQPVVDRFMKRQQELLSKGTANRTEAMEGPGSIEDGTATHDQIREEIDRIAQDETVTIDLPAPITEADLAQLRGALDPAALAFGEPLVQLEAA